MGFAYLGETATTGAAPLRISAAAPENVPSGAVSGVPAHAKKTLMSVRITSVANFKFNETKSGACF